MNLTDPEKVLARLTTDWDKQAQRFAERVVLAKMTKAEAVKQTELEWDFVQKWISSKAKSIGSFLFSCDLFELEPTAVLRAIKEKR